MKKNILNLVLVGVLSVLFLMVKLVYNVNNVVYNMKKMIDFLVGVLVIVDGRFIIKSDFDMIK